MSLKYKVDIDKVGLDSAAKAYGGYLEAYSFYETTFDEWFNEFRTLILSKIGNEYVPVYRMADGEYRFLMGRKYNFNKKPLLRELIAVTAEKLRIKNPNKWKTSWGEEYAPKQVRKLRENLINDIKEISQNGYLACYYNENGLQAFLEYNKYLVPFFNKQDIKFDRTNYIPFHFVCGLLVCPGWEEFYLNRHILIVSGTDDSSEEKIKTTILNLGAKKLSFLRISKTASMQEKINLSKIKSDVDLCFVSAGIGSANIIKQLQLLNTVTLDIGGYINCFINKNASQHGGIFKLPS